MSFMNAVSPGWFDTVGARLIEGRDVTPADDDTRIIVNETFARAYLEDGPVTGQVVYMSGPSGVSSPLQVIGLTSDVAYQAPRGGMVPTIFVPAGTNAASSLAVRVAAGQHAYVSAAIPAALRQVDPTVSFTLRSFDELASGWVAQERLTAALSVAFGVLALLLAAVGLYGVMAYAVNRRRREIAVRLALGAGRGSIVRLIVAQGGLLVSAGLLAGALLSWWGATFLESLLFQHQARDLPTIGIAALVLGATGLIAAWLPARRASRIEPAGLLREG